MGPSVEANLPTAYSQAGFNYAGDLAFDPEFLVPYRGYGNTLEYYKFDGTSNYDSLQVSLQRRFSKGLTFGTAYTFSKALTTASADEDLQDTFSPRKYDYRLASYEVPHVLAINYVYDVPNLAKYFNGPKWLSYVTDNFQLSGVAQFMTGGGKNSRSLRKRLLVCERLKFSVAGTVHVTAAVSRTQCNVHGNHVESV